MVHAANKHGEGYLENQPPADLPKKEDNNNDD